MGKAGGHFSLIPHPFPSLENLQTCISVTFLFSFPFLLLLSNHPNIALLKKGRKSLTIKVEVKWIIDIELNVVESTIIHFVLQNLCDAVDVF